MSSLCNIPNILIDYVPIFELRVHFKNLESFNNNHKGMQTDNSESFDSYGSEMYHVISEVTRLSEYPPPHHSPENAGMPACIHPTDQLAVLF